MRLILLISICLLAGGAGYAQRITLHLPYTTFKVIKDTLEKTGRYKFSYPGHSYEYKNIFVWVDSAMIEEVLTQVFRDRPLGYKITNENGIQYILIIPLPLSIKGKVLDDLGKPQENIAIRVKDPRVHARTLTDKHGNFMLSGVPESAELEISSTNTKLKIVPVAGRDSIEIRVQRIFSNLPSYTLAYINNGYQDVTAAFTTGSSATEDKNALLSVISSNLIDHFSGRISGLTPGGPGNLLGFAIRGRTTLLSTSTPLLVWDHFPYGGNIGDINPYDLQSINVLKDAASAGIWGAYSGNGVMVLNSNEGRYYQQQLVTLTMNTTFTEKPRLSYQPRMSPASYIGADSILFSRGYFDSWFYDPQHPVPPSVEVLWKERQGLVSSAEGQAQIAQMANHNVLDDLNRYYYRSHVSHEYHISLEGGNKSSKYYGSIGYDRDPTDLVRNDFERITLHGSYTARPGLDKWEISLAGNLTSVNYRDNNSGDPGVAYPYATLADGRGHPLSVSYLYNPQFVDTAGSSFPVSFQYKPLQELQLADNHTGRVSGYLQGMVKYQIHPDVSLEVFGRWMKGHSFKRDQYDKNGFYVRNLVNTFSQLKTGQAGFLFPVPDANILFLADTEYTSRNLRGQLSYHHVTGQGNQLTGFLGAEINDQETTGQTQQFYGHDNQTGNALMDFVNPYLNRVTGGTHTIPTDDELLGMSNRSVSVYSNASYTWGQSYTLYAAFRMDASNIVGVNDDLKWGPFWSLGASHNLTLSSRAGTERAPLVKLRISYGCNGNASDKTAYLVTQNLGTNAYGVNQNGIGNPPDPTLGWERIYILNAGVDFGFFRDSASRHGRLFGSLDLYQRRSVNLLSNDSLAPSTGVPLYLDNTAGITGEGIDLVLNSVNSRYGIKWNSTLLFSLTRDRISHYRYQPRPPSSYVSGEFPMLGKASTALYSFAWAGLDHATGDPLGRVGNEVRNDYAALMNDPNAKAVYSGTWQPVVFGSLQNTFGLGRWSLSMLISYKTGYSFRRPSVNYSVLAAGGSPGNRDYNKRWQAPGDEAGTSIPSIPNVPLDPNRDLFYMNSSVLVTRADNVRWQDCNLSYEWATKNHGTRPFRSAIVYIYVSNIGLLWTSNHFGIDPDAAGFGQMPAARAYSIGARFKF